MYIGKSASNKNEKPYRANFKRYIDLKSGSLVELKAYINESITPAKNIVCIQNCIFGKMSCLCWIRNHPSVNRFVFSLLINLHSFVNIILRFLEIEIAWRESEREKKRSQCIFENEKEKRK